MAKKRHHTVSEFLLQRFATDGKVCQLEVGSGGNRRIPPNDATVEKHFYSIDIDGGQRSPAVEDALGQVESVGAPLIERVMNGEFLESTQRSELALFAAMTWLRTPRWRQETQSVLE